MQTFNIIRMDFDTCTIYVVYVALTLWSEHKKPNSGLYDAVAVLTVIIIKV